MESARVKVEASGFPSPQPEFIQTIELWRRLVINEDINLELLELLELYCELLVARFGLLDQLYAGSSYLCFLSLTLDLAPVSQIRVSARVSVLSSMLLRGLK